VGLPSPWHQDNAYWCLEPASGLTIWIALDAADAENGGVNYLRGSHRLGLLPHQPSYAPGSSQTIMSLPALDCVTPALAPGDALVHHCLTIHGSSANRSGRARRGVTLQYQGASAQVNQEKLQQYESALEVQVRGRA
jgi:ectoine hydroxylase-related dioxygenase (phytanoyl-CoA dioxygenase family)